MTSSALSSPFRSVSIPMPKASEITVRQSPTSVRQSSAVTPTTVADRIIDFLRRVHPVKTAENIAADTGISSRTVAKWLERGSVPNGQAIFKLIGTYGPEFACAAIANPPSWLSQAARDEEQRRLRAQIAKLQAKLDGECL